MCALLLYPQMASGNDTIERSFTIEFLSYSSYHNYTCKYVEVSAKMAAVVNINRLHRQMAVCKLLGLYTYNQIYGRVF